MKIILAGNGELAKVIRKVFRKNNVEILDIDKIIKIEKFKKEGIPNFLVFCGSERNLEKSIKICKINKIKLLLLSTNINLNLLSGISYKYLPNTSGEVVGFFEMVYDYYIKNNFKKIKILESHQSSKKDISGTARTLCDKLKKNYKNIVSIRNIEEQIKLGVPSKYLYSHAYHKVTLSKLNLEISFELLVCGKDLYASGLLEYLYKNKL
jgi:hypothetical protein